MLNTFTPERQKPEKKERKKRIQKERERLVLQQQMLKEKKLPVLVLAEGWGAAGKGTLIGNLIKDLDPRFFNVVPIKAATEEEKRKPFLWRYMEHIPEAGKIVFLDSGWIEETVAGMLHHGLEGEALDERMESIRVFERQLKDNGYLLVKLFLHISKEEQKERIDKLLEEKDTRWRVSPMNLEQTEKREMYEKAFDTCLEATDTDNLPWNIIDASNQKDAVLTVLSLLTQKIDQAAENQEVPPEILHKEYPLLSMPKLDEVPLDQKMDREEYEVRLEKLQKKLKKLHNTIYRRKIPVVIAYEGWDAAGKGGNIKRLTSALDARGFEVHPIAAPEPHEISRHYLWRFWHRLPKNGHIGIFDRTWYGRVMVERLEGFCSENDWKRAYNEINEFEKMLSDWGAIVIKFWVQIDKDTQLMRFKERENTPQKRWKITQEDWRNREKWDQYEVAVNEMIQKTSTENAPWHIISSNNKYYARIQAIEILLDALEHRLKG